MTLPATRYTCEPKIVIGFCRNNTRNTSAVVVGFLIIEADIVTVPGRYIRIIPTVHIILKPIQIIIGAVKAIVKWINPNIIIQIIVPFIYTTRTATNCISMKK